MAAKRGRPKRHLFDVSELCDFLNVSRTTLYELIEKGLPYHRVGFHRRFDLEIVMAWLTARLEKRRADGYE